MYIDFAGNECQCTGGTGCSLTTVSKTYTANSTYTISKPQGYDGMKSATVTVSVPGPELEEVSYSITGNGTTLITPTSGKYISGGTISVAVPGPGLEQRDYAFYANGQTSITPSEGHYISGGTITVSLPFTDKDYSITANGTTTITVPDGYQGITGGTISVEVSGSSPSGGYSVNDVLNGAITSITDSDLVGIDDFSMSPLGNVTTISGTGITAVSQTYFINNMSLEDVYLPNCVEIGTSAFTHSENLTGVTLGSGVSLGAACFAECYSLTDFNGGDFSIISHFGGMDFKDCETLEGQVVFSSTMVEDQGGSVFTSYNSFNNCQSINSFTFPSNTTDVGGGYNFYNCLAPIFDFTACQQVPTTNATNFYNIDSQAEIRVPASLYNDWIAASGWNDANVVGHIVAVS